MRQTIAKRLKQAQENAALLTTFNEVDMTNIMEMRKENQQDFQSRYGIKLGFMSFFVKACVVALKHFPAVNAEIDGDEIIYKNYYNISFAVGTDKGLVVPVLRNVETPIVTDNKIKLKFKSNAIKKHFMDEMEDPRSKNALKLAINKSYGSELDLQISSPKEENNQTDSAKQEETSSSIKKALSMGAKIINENT